MLKIIKAQDPNQVTGILQKMYDPACDTWIVSDLKSKNEVQEFSIKKLGFYTDDAILRASDFWRLWLRRLSPEMNVVSSDFIKSLVYLFADKFKQELAIEESEYSTLYSAVEEFAPILLHPAGEQTMSEWQNSLAEPRQWYRWYILARAALTFLVRERRSLDSRWIPAWLQSQQLSQLTWPKRMFIDLGSELSAVELGLIQAIAQNQEIILIAPSPHWQKRYATTLGLYLDLNSSVEICEINQTENSKKGNTEFVRLSTELAEVKFAVSKIRTLLDQGHSLEDFAIISPDIECYWPALQFYLLQEGVPAQKDVTANLNSVSSIQRLGAYLKNISAEVDWHSLETVLYGKSQQYALDFEKFKSLFLYVFDEDDLKRDQKIHELFQRSRNLSEDVSRIDFFGFFVKIWIEVNGQGEADSIFELIVRDLLANSQEIKMSMSRWIQFLKLRLSRKEFRIAGENPGNGVLILPLMASSMVTAKFRFYLGLHDEKVQRHKRNLMAAEDLLFFQKHLGLEILTDEESTIDFNLRWQDLNFSGYTYYCTSYLSFGGDILNPCLFFIENSPHSKLTFPENTRVDDLQMGVSSILHKSFAADHQVNLARVIEDKEGAQTHFNELSAFRKLSVSDIEEFSRCSFKLLARRGFKLRDYPAQSLDMDPRQRGNMVHFAFQKSIELLQSQEFSIDRMKILLSEKKSEMGMYIGQDHIWKVQQDKLIQLVQKFSEFEMDRLKYFKASVEEELSLYYNFNQKKLQSESIEGGIKISMRVDRYDIHREKKYAVIYDYKSSSGAVYNHNKWIPEIEIQMLLYILALEAKLPSDVSIKGALYYVFRDFQINRGLISDSVAKDDFGFKKRMNSCASDEEISALKEEFEILITEIFDRLNSGKFQAMPIKQEICHDCDWNKICRAPHLN